MAITGWRGISGLCPSRSARGDRGHDRIRRSVPPSTAKVTDADRKGVSAHSRPARRKEGGKPWPPLHACAFALTQSSGPGSARGSAASCSSL